MPTLQALTAISAASDGTVYGFNNGVLLQASSSQPWTGVSGQVLAGISAAFDGTVWGLTSNQAVYSYTNGSWVSVSCAYQLQQVSVGNATAIWGLDSKGITYQFTTGSGWTPIQSNFQLSNISATADGSVWGLDSSGNAYQFTSAQGWYLIQVQPEEPLVSISGSNESWAWGIGQSGAAYQFDGAGAPWIKVLPLSGGSSPALKAVSCGGDTTVLAMDNAGNAYQFDPEEMNWDRFTSLPGATFGSLSVGNAQNLWALDTSGNVWQYTAGNWNWAAVSVTSAAPLSQIAVGSASDIWALDASGNVYQLTATPGSVTATQLAGAPQLSQIAVGADQTVAGIQTGATPTFVQYANGAWSAMAELPQPPSFITVGSGSNIWALDNQANLYQYVYQVAAGQNAWQAVASPAYPTRATLGSLSAASDGSLWGVTTGQLVCVYFGADDGWYITGVSLAQIAAVSQSDIWGIDTSGNAANVTLGAGQTGGASASFSEGSVRPRGHKVGWDAESVTDEQYSTHLWIVNRAMNVANLEAGAGSDIYALYHSAVNTAFYQGLTLGLYSADFLPAYNNPILGQATWSSHFYDPNTGLNYLGQSYPTGLTQCRLFFWNALAAYLNEDMSNAGFNLGLALHYLTDATQPMHAANFTFLNSYHTGYHTSFEAYVMQCQSEVSAPTAYTPWPAGTDPFDIDPGEYLITAAQNSSSKYYSAVCPTNPISFHDPGILVQGKSILWRPMVAPLIPGMLTDAINITSQFLVGWMTLANSDIQACTLVNLASGLVADVQNASKNAGTKLWLYLWNNTSAQLLHLNPTSDTPPSYTIICSCSGQNVDVANGSTAAGADIVQNPKSGGASQLWQLSNSPSVDGSQVIQNNNSSLYITPTSGGSSQGTLLVQDSADPSGGQEWLVVPAAPVYIQTVGASSKPLNMDITNASTKAGALLQVYTPNKTVAQVFLWVALVGDDSGYYMILNSASGLCLYLVDGQTSVQQQSWDGSDNAKWSRVPGPGSAFYIQNKAGQTLDGQSFSYLYVPSDASGTPVGYASSVVNATPWTLSAAPPRPS